jgi:hypothetical protein
MSRVNEKLVRCLGGLAAGAVLFTGVQAAWARGSGAIIGTAQVGAQAACFMENWGGIQRIDTSPGAGLASCPSPRQAVAWCAPLVYDNAGGRNVQVNVFGDGADSEISCGAFSIAWDGGGTVWGSGDRSGNHVGRPGRNMAFSLGLPHAHGFGDAHVCCWMKPGSVFRSLHYNP